MAMLVTFFVGGWPKTKGSVEHIGRGRVKQSVQGSGAWARRVEQHAEDAFTARYGTVPGGYSYAGPVSVHLTYWLPVDDVTQPGCGDIDKLERNVLDALTKAGVYVDDVQVVRCCHEKWPHRPDRNPPVPAGILVRVFEGYV